MLLFTPLVTPIMCQPALRTCVVGAGALTGSGLLLPYAQAMRQGRRWWMSGGMLNLVIAVLVIILLVVLILQFV
jgi:hypothetical protein